MVETRVARYSRKNEAKRKTKKILKTITKYFIYLIVGLFSAIYFFLKASNKAVEKMFTKLPRIIKVLLIYMLVFNFCYNIYDTIPKTEKEIIMNFDSINSNSIPTDLIVEEQNNEICIFDSISCKISNKGKEIGLNEEEILIAIAISKHETGDYTSYAFKELNNVGGMMCNSGLRQYDSLEDGIEAYLNNLKYNYFDIGLDTLEKIQPKYCPIGASNDPNGLNKYWLSGTQNKYNELAGK